MSRNKSSRRRKVRSGLSRRCRTTLETRDSGKAAVEEGLKPKAEEFAKSGSENLREHVMVRGAQAASLLGFGC